MVDVPDAGEPERIVVVDSRCRPILPESLPIPWPRAFCVAQQERHGRGHLFATECTGISGRLRYTGYNTVELHHISGAVSGRASRLGKSVVCAFCLAVLQV